jgi:hypothetical protein
MRAVKLFVVLLAVLWPGHGSAANEDAYVPRNDPQRIQAIVEALRARLEIPHDVRVSIVPANALLVSVESPTDWDDAFVLSLEDGFVDELDDEELGAVLAHELGHVWIFTHHPYLQTERQANRIAMRLVSQESLRRAYRKVWDRLGTNGDLAEFLSD